MLLVDQMSTIRVHNKFFDNRDVDKFLQGACKYLTILCLIGSTCEIKTSGPGTDDRRLEGRLETSAAGTRDRNLMT